VTPDFTKPTALFGGSFDPVHEGHLHVAREVKRLLPGAQLVFVPASISPGKRELVAPGGLRLKWLQAVAAKEGFLVWDTELKRQGPSYTVDTLLEAHRLGAKKRDLFFVMGADSYQNFSRWRGPEKIRELCRIVVVTRPGSPLSAGPEACVLTIPPHLASSTAIRKGLGQNPPLTDHLPPEVKSDLEDLTLLSQNPYVRKLT
jgi:nicotinate-nucleotide adenylyltransferase